MSVDPRAGRPRASSRATLAEAACELFLEQGYEATSILEIAQRAGVSRSSFFNYFASKADILWSGLDERLEDFETLLEHNDEGDAAPDVREAILLIAADFTPDSLALALVNARAMGLVDELEREAALRRSRVARTVSRRYERGGASRLRADVIGAAYGGAVLAAVEAWARDGAGSSSLTRILEAALDVAGEIGVVTPHR